MLTTLAWRNLWRNKRRTFIVIAAIMFAVLLSTVMDSVQVGVYEHNIKNMVSFYTGYAQVHQKGYWDNQILDNTFEETPELIGQIKANPHVTDVVSRIESFALVASEDETISSQLIGFDPESEQVLTKLKDKVVEGVYPSKDDKALLVAQGLAEKLGLGIGDSMVLLGQGYQGRSAAGIYPIKAIAKFGSPELNKSITYLPLKEAQFFFAAENRLTSYALVLDKGSALEEVITDLNQKLDTSTYEVMDWNEMMPWLMQMQQADAGGNKVMMGILYLVIGFVIFGTLLMMIQERKYEFGVVMAVGMKKYKVAIMTFIEMFFMTVIGIVLSFALTIPVLIYFNRNPIELGGEMQEVYQSYGFEAIIPASLDPSIFIYQALTVFVLALVVYVLSINKVFRIRPVEAMRH